MNPLFRIRLGIIFLLQFAFYPAAKAQVLSLADTLRPDSAIVREVIITGNQKTVRRIITRELTFKEGDTLAAYVLEAAIERSRQNIMNIGLFNFVDIQYFRGAGKDIILHITVTERWYLWPLPIFEIADRNFNEWVQKRDLSRTNIGMDIKQDNFRGMDETVRLQFIFGYTQRLGLYYQVPYINKKQNLGFQAGMSVSRNREVMYQVEGNKLKFYNEEDDFVRKDFQSYVRMTRRKGYYEFYNFTFDYRRSTVKDTVLELNNLYFADGGTIQQHMGFGFSYRNDHRDYQPYALKGTMYEMEAFKVGLGLLPHEPDLIGIAFSYRKYHPITKRLNLAGAAKIRFMQQARGPFVNQRALGYGSDYIRTYDYYVINGQNFYLLKSNLKYTLLPVKVYQVPGFQSEKFKKMPVSFHLNAFFDAGYSKDNYYADANPLSNSVQYAYGIGLDFVTYYDLVFRLEYGNNKINEPGLFFHIGAAF